MRTQKRIFVTGAPRSGTTFVGKILSIPKEASNLHEPFNPRCGMPEIDQQYLYLNQSSPDDSPYRQAIVNLFDDSFTLKTGQFKEDARWRSLLKSFIGSASAWSVRLAKLKPWHTTWIIKDPIGCLLTEFLASNYDIKPVILIRHPAAVVASVKRMNWTMNLDPLRAQSDLIDDHFAGDEMISRYKDASGIEGSAALWTALNTVILRQAKRNPSWMVVTHEELCQQPSRIFRHMYSELGLPWSNRVENEIRKYTGQHNPSGAKDGVVHSFERDSVGLLDQSLSMLTKDERRTVFEITGSVASDFYSKESFKLDEE